MLQRVCSGCHACGSEVDRELRLEAGRAGDGARKHGDVERISSHQLDLIKSHNGLDWE